MTVTSQLNPYMEQDIAQFRAALDADNTLDGRFKEGMESIFDDLIRHQVICIEERLESFRLLGARATSLKGASAQRRGNYEYHLNKTSSEVRREVREKFALSGEKLSETRLKDEVKYHADVIERTRLAAEAEATEDLASSLMFLLKDILKATIEQSTNVRREIASANGG